MKYGEVMGSKCLLMDESLLNSLMSYYLGGSASQNLNAPVVQSISDCMCQILIYNLNMIFLYIIQNSLILLWVDGFDKFMLMKNQKLINKQEQKISYKEIKTENQTLQREILQILMANQFVNSSQKQTNINARSIITSIVLMVKKINKSKMGKAQQCLKWMNQVKNTKKANRQLLQKIQQLRKQQQLEEKGRKGLQEQMVGLRQLKQKMQEKDKQNEGLINYVGKYSAQINQKDDKIRQLGDRIKQIEQVHEEKLKQNERNAKIDLLQHVKQANKRRQGLISKVEGLELQIERQGKLLSEKDKQKQEIEEQLQNMRQQSEVKQKNTKNKESQLIIQLGNGKEKIQQLQLKIVELKEQMQRYQENIKSNEQKHINETKRISEEKQVLEQQLARLKEKLQLVNSEVNEKQKLVYELERTGDEHKSSLQKEIQELTSKLSASEGQLSKLKESIEEKDKAASELERTGDEHKSSLQKEIQELTSKLSTLSSQLSTLLQQISQKTTLIQKLTQEKANCDNKFIQLNKSYRRLQVQSYSLNSQIKSLHNTVSESEYSLFYQNQDESSLSILNSFGSFMFSLMQNINKQRQQKQQLGKQIQKNQNYNSQQNQRSSQNSKQQKLNQEVTLYQSLLKDKNTIIKQLQTKISNMSDFPHHLLNKSEINSSFDSIDLSNTQIKGRKNRISISQIPDQSQFLKELNKQPSSNQHINNIFTNVKELSFKIQHFNPKISIISRMNSSKFLTNIENKISFILQYACILQIYFSMKFLSHIRQELFMSEHINLHPINQQDLNPKLFQSQNILQREKSFLNQSSRLSTKLYIANQYSLQTVSQIEKKSEKTVENEKINNHLKQFQKIQKELEEIKENINKYAPNKRDIEQNPKLAAGLSSLKGNQMAQMMVLLMNENKAVKKCLNQMIQNEANITEQHNEQYFEEKEEQQSVLDISYTGTQANTSKVLSSTEEKQGKSKQNCVIF